MVDIGEIVPDFELQNHNGEIVRLSDFRGKRVVLFTFAKAGTLGCTAEVCSIRDNFPKFDFDNVVVLGMGSNDSPEALKEWREREKLPYDLLADPEYKVTDALKLRTVSLFNMSLNTPLFGLMVIDEHGKLAYRKVPVSPWATAKLAAEALEQMPA